MILIGEKINATRASVRKALEARDEAFLAGLVREQDRAGASYIDLNSGTGSGSASQESDDMIWLIDLALGATEKPLCVDSADPAVIGAAAGHLSGRRPWMLNSIKGDRKTREALLPLAAEHGIPFVALAMNEDGIPADAEGRLSVCADLFGAAADHGIPPENVFFDPLVLPVVTDVSQGCVTLEVIRAVPGRFPGARTVMGLSNVSHGLPRRALLNRTFLAMAVEAGLDAALCDPTRRALRAEIFAAEALAGRDKNCRRYARAYRRGDLEVEPPRGKEEA